MKIRNGFVSNSSSSSFICDHCGQEEAGMNLELEWAGMVECDGGHTICDRHINFSDGCDRYDWPSDDCPCCQFDTIPEYVVNAYAFHLLGKNRKDLEKEIRSKFNTEKEFWEAIQSSGKMNKSQQD